MISVGIKPFRPQQFHPPTPIAAMIRIGQSIIQLPLRLPPDATRRRDI
jgi:hypothetical protein